MNLTFDDLFQASKKRQEIWDPQGKITLSFRGNEHLAEEIGDVVITAALVALDAGIDFREAIRNKFNLTSDKMQIDIKI